MHPASPWLAAATLLALAAPALAAPPTERPRSIAIFVLSGEKVGAQLTDVYAVVRQGIEAETALEVAPLEVFPSSVRDSAIRRCAGDGACFANTVRESGVAVDWLLLVSADRLGEGVLLGLRLVDLRLAAAGQPPNLAAVGDKSPDGLLPSILDPNRSIPEPFIAYTALTRDGNELTGIIAAESPNSITLRMANGSEESLLRADLKSLGASRQSLMPEGFENSLDIPAMADLLAFIATSGPLPKSFPGNQPATVTPDPEGILRLAASRAEIHGSTLIFESKYRNLGFWQSEDDHAVWTAEIPKAGSYELWLDFASPSSPGSHSLRVEAGDTSVAFRIPSTGSWDVYQQTRAGKIQLPAGAQRIRVRAVPPVHEPILDLRELRLVPSRD